jgi:Flp pilus assembly protein CpaB
VNYNTFIVGMNGDWRYRQVKRIKTVDRAGGRILKRRRAGVLLIILGIIIAAGVGGTTWWFSKNVSTQTKTSMTSAVVATQEINERASIQASSLITKEVPAELVPPGAATKIDQVAGKMATEPIHAGEVVLMANLADTKGTNGLAYTVEPGKVVITFPASDIIGTGAVKAGDSVDIFVTLRPAEKQGDAANQAVAQKQSVAAAVTQVTLQNLKVLAIGSVVVTDEANKNNQQQKATNANQLITFSVSHQDALALKALKDTPEAVLEMVLRSAGDQNVVKTNPVTVKDLIEKYGLAK